MKLSDYVAAFIARQGIRHVFAISGGASVHLIHSLDRTPGTGFICPAHEQAGAMAADAYARATGGLGAAVTTSGPGATNLLTGVCCAWYDSVPVLYVTGQVTTFRMSGDSGVRQMGFQETATVEMFRPVTKYAVRVDDPGRIRFELEKAVHLARAGRPGPVLIDLPDDVQRMEVDADRLEGFTPPPAAEPRAPRDADLDRCLALFREARRPVLILGWGVRMAHAEAEAEAALRALGVPVALTWAALDLLPSDDPLAVGPFGTHGTRHGNFAVQNADLLCAVGARLDTREAGSPFTSFGRGARKIVVDVDPCELRKFKRLGADIDLLVEADAREFLRRVAARSGTASGPSRAAWLERIRGWKARYPICRPEFHREEALNPYVFVKALAAASAEGDRIVLDTGCALAWTCQAFDFKRGQRLFHAFNNTPMGYALPAAIGVSLAGDGAPVTCVSGDGSLQMNIQELATVIRHRLPIRIFLINNHGYSMIQQTQDQWLGSKYLASSVDGGLAFPDWVAVARAYGFPTVTIARNDEAADRIREVFAVRGPVFCNVEIRPEHRVLPQVKFGRPIEDGEPLLDRAEFLENMIVPPAESSRT